jgi:YD repeat-containing protein
MKTTPLNLLLLSLLLLLMAVAYGSGMGTDGTISSGTGTIDPSGLYRDTDPLLTDTGTTTGESAVIQGDTMSIDSLSTGDSTQTTQTMQSGQGQGYQMVRYTYDEFDRLKSSRYENGTVIGYDYDKVGNRTAKTVEAGGGQIHTISITSTGDGEAVPSGVLAVMAGSNQTVLFQPDAGASVTTLTIDGIRTPVSSSYTFTNITANHTVSASFGGSQSCSGYPAQLAGTTPVSHLSLQSAYDAAAPGDTIMGNLDDHQESLRFDRDLQVTLAGGYNCAFTSLTGLLTVKGSMLLVAGEVTISSGTVVLAAP